jgi:hypothetical protein
VSYLEKKVDFFSEEKIDVVLTLPFSFSLFPLLQMTFYRDNSLMWV